MAVALFLRVRTAFACVVRQCRTSLVMCCSRPHLTALMRKYGTNCQPRNSTTRPTCLLAFTRDGDLGELHLRLVKRVGGETWSMKLAQSARGAGVVSTSGCPDCRTLLWSVGLRTSRRRSSGRSWLPLKELEGDPGLSFQAHLGLLRERAGGRARPFASKDLLIGMDTLWVSLLLGTRGGDLTLLGARIYSGIIRNHVHMIIHISRVVRVEMSFRGWWRTWFIIRRYAEMNRAPRRHHNVRTERSTSQMRAPVLSTQKICTGCRSMQFCTKRGSSKITTSGTETTTTRTLRNWRASHEGLSTNVHQVHSCGDHRHEPSKSRLWSVFFRGDAAQVQDTWTGLCKELVVNDSGCGLRCRGGMVTGGDIGALWVAWSIGHHISLIVPRVCRRDFGFHRRGPRLAGTVELPPLSKWQTTTSHAPGDRRIQMGVATSMRFYWRGTTLQNVYNATCGGSPASSWWSLRLWRGAIWCSWGCASGTRRPAGTGATEYGYTGEA